MKTYPMGKYDVIVIGAGHAGCEAGLAAARMGKRTLMLSINLEAVAMMACNPSIGGTGKGHLVKEVDALGGQMGLNIDKTFIQSRMLNTAKGPAVHSLRAQADKNAYHAEMKKTLEEEPLLDLRQGEVVDLLIEGAAEEDAEDDVRSGENDDIRRPTVIGVALRTGAVYEAGAVILATGTFLGGKVFIGDSVYESGPNGMAPSTPLAEKLREYGFPMRRFKTGTPARALGRSLHKEKMIRQEGDEVITPFSFMNDELEKDQIDCWLTYTNEKTHRVIRENSHRSALFGGQIEGVGPRYCPSIEDKIHRFPDRARHQLFIEPEGLTTDEVYIQGMSSSLPEDVQGEFYRTIEGLEDLEIVRPAYAIEYDCIDPLALKSSLESRAINNLFCAGQFNGSSGYEEAAAQGLMAGINAVLALDGKEPFVLDRSEAYIGVLIDDLVTKGTGEPYRIMTSRAEYRLLLRQDNADLRLTEKGYEVGLVSEERYRRTLKKRENIEKEMARIGSTFLSPEKINPILEEKGSTPVDGQVKLIDILRRPEISYADTAAVDEERPELSRQEAEVLQIQIKYAGYIEKQRQQVEKFKRLENKRLSEDLDYESIEGLRIEARQKLTEHRPISIGQASRISGVSPADINVLIIHLERMRRQNDR